MKQPVKKYFGAIALSCIAAAVVLLAFNEYIPAREASKEVAGDMVENPVYPEIKKVARRYGFKPEFSRYVRSYKLQTFAGEVFCHERKSLDILFVGDSLLGWGIIPEVVEQQTGLKIGVFAQRGMYLNPRTLKVLERLRNFYLKEGGLTVFHFDLWTQEQRPNILRREDDVSRVEALDEGQFLQLAEQRFVKCHGKKPQTFSSKGARREFMFSSLSLEKHEHRIKSLEKKFKQNYHMGLPQQTPLHLAVLRGINPQWYVEKQIEEHYQHEGGTKEKKRVGRIYSYLRWNRRATIWQYRRRLSSSIFSDKKPNMNMRISENIKTNAAALLKFPGKKAYMIGFFNNHGSYIKSRTYYEKFYAVDLKKIDLGILHPKGEGYPVDRVSHCLNESAFVKSALISQWINKEYSAN